MPVTVIVPPLPPDALAVTGLAASTLPPSAVREDAARDLFDPGGRDHMVGGERWPWHRHCRPWRQLRRGSADRAGLGDLAALGAKDDGEEPSSTAASRIRTWEPEISPTVPCGAVIVPALRTVRAISATSPPEDPTRAEVHHQGGAVARKGQVATVEEIPCRHIQRRGDEAAAGVDHAIAADHHAGRVHQIDRSRGAQGPQSSGRRPARDPVQRRARAVEEGHRRPRRCRSCPSRGCHKRWSGRSPADRGRAFPPSPRRRRPPGRPAPLAPAAPRGTREVPIISAARRVSEMGMSGSSAQSVRRSHLVAASMAAWASEKPFSVTGTRIVRPPFQATTRKSTALASAAGPAAPRSSAPRPAAGRRAGHIDGRAPGAGRRALPRPRPPDRAARPRAGRPRSAVAGAGPLPRHGAHQHRQEGAQLAILALDAQLGQDLATLLARRIGSAVHHPVAIGRRGC